MKNYEPITPFERLRYARERVGLKQSDLIDLLSEEKLPVSSYSSIERGKMSLSVNLLIEISRILKIDIRYFTGDLSFDDARALFLTEAQYSAKERGKIAEAGSASLLNSAIDALISTKGCHSIEEMLGRGVSEDQIDEIIIYRLKSKSAFRRLIKTVLFYSDDIVMKLIDLALGILVGYNIISTVGVNTPNPKQKKAVKK